MPTNSTVLRWFFVTDVDDTLMGDDASLANLASALTGKREQVLLAFNSSRPCASVRNTIQTSSLVPEPDYLIGALGTEIEYRDGKFMKGYSDLLNAGWDRDRIAGLMEQLGLQAHPDEFQTPYKASYTIDVQGQYQEVLELLAGHGMEVKTVISGRTNMDLIPKNAGKGAAIQFLRKRLDIKPGRVVTAGDSRNDLDMFAFPNKVIVVGNAESDLKSLPGEHIYQARAAYAAGVLEGLRFWGVV